jgi:hypothetical protein
MLAEVATKIQREYRAYRPIKLMRNPGVQDDWGRNIRPDRGLYKKLAQSHIGLWGSVTALWAQHVMRLSLIPTIDQRPG